MTPAAAVSPGTPPGDLHERLRAAVELNMCKDPKCSCPQVTAAVTAIAEEAILRARAEIAATVEAETTRARAEGATAALREHADEMRGVWAGDDANRFLSRFEYADYIEARAEALRPGEPT
jgi:hypothetical protein